MASICQDKFERVETCPVCGESVEGKRKKKFYSHRDDKYLLRLNPKKNREVVFWSCKSCDFIFQSPRWTPETAREFYAEKYRLHDPKPGVIKGKAQDASDMYDWVVDAWAPPAKPKMLDVGAGEGCLPRVFKSMAKEENGGAKWDCYAVEPNKRYAEYAKKKMKIKIQMREFDGNCWLGLKFDLITATHVLEHLHEPYKMLKDIRRKIKTGGRALFAVPTLDMPCGPGWKRVQEVDGNFTASPHLYLFTARTLVRMLNKAGFYADRLDYIERGMLCLARYAHEGEANEICGRDGIKKLRANIDRARELEREYISLLKEQERVQGTAEAVA